MTRHAAYQYICACVLVEYRLNNKQSEMGQCVGSAMKRPVCRLKKGLILSESLYIIMKTRKGETVENG